MFFTADVFLDMILLLINQRGHTDIMSIIKRFLDVYETESKNAAAFDTMGEGEYIRFYVSVIKELMIPGLDDSDVQRCLLKFKAHPFIRTHEDIYDILEGIMINTNPLDADKQEFIKRRVNDYILTYECNTLVKKMFGKVNGAQSTTDDFKRAQFLEEIQHLCDQMTRGFSATPTGSITSGINKIDFSDKDSIRQGVMHHRANKVTNVLKTGWQGINDMFDRRGGIHRREAILFCALGYNYKSTMLLNMAKWIVMHNDPIQVEGKGAPTVLFISLENEAAENMMYLYRSVYEVISGQSIHGKTDDEIIDFIYDYYNSRGWKLIIERKLGADFGYAEFRTLYEEYTAQGFDIQAAIIDYLSMMKKIVGENDRSGHHLQIRYVYTQMVNYLKHKDCTFITAHQLNRTASDLAKSGVNHVVKKYHMGLLADSVDPYREVDVVIFLQIESNSYGNTYLTMYMEKNRYIPNIPDKHKFCAYRFSVAGIPDDLTGKKQYIHDIYTDNYEPDKADAAEADDGLAQAACF